MQTDYRHSWILLVLCQLLPDKRGGFRRVTNADKREVTCCFVSFTCVMRVFETEESRPLLLPHRPLLLQLLLTLMKFLEATGLLI